MTDAPATEEVLLRQTLPVFVNSFNQLTYLRDSLDWFHRHGFGNVTVLEQGSDYPPLVDYLNSAECAARARVHRLPENVGPRAALDEAPGLRDGMIHVFTDPDLALPDPPHPEMITRMMAAARHHKAHRVGLALDISEPHLFSDQRLFAADGPTVAEWEARFWRDEVETGVYRANVDTTFHLFNPYAPPTLQNRYRNFVEGRRRLQSIRMAGPGFTARHRPWYRNDGQTDEERAYYRTRSGAWNTWNGTGDTPAPARELERTEDG